jgi:hypothetical protein
MVDANQSGHIAGIRIAKLKADSGVRKVIWDFFMIMQYL